MMSRDQERLKKLQSNKEEIDSILSKHRESSLVYTYWQSISKFLQGQLTKEELDHIVRYSLEDNIHLHNNFLHELLNFPFSKASNLSSIDNICTNTELMNALSIHIQEHAYPLDSIPTDILISPKERNRLLENFSKIQNAQIISNISPSISLPPLSDTSPLTRAGYVTGSLPGPDEIALRLEQYGRYFLSDPNIETLKSMSKSITMDGLVPFVIESAMEIYLKEFIDAYLSKPIGNQNLSNCETRSFLPSLYPFANHFSDD